MYAYNGILSGDWKREQVADACSDTDDFHNHKLRERALYTRTENAWFMCSSRPGTFDLWLKENQYEYCLWESGAGIDGEYEFRNFLGCWQRSLHWDGYGLCIYICQNSTSVHLRLVHFIGYKLYVKRKIEEKYWALVDDLLTEVLRGMLMALVVKNPHLTMQKT